MPATLLILAAPATASAGSASVGTAILDAKYAVTAPGLFYVAAPGERNQVVVTREGFANPASYTVRDAGASVSAGLGCVALDAHAARCTASGALVDAGDGDDSVALPQLGGVIRGYARGGAGADTLSGAGVLAGGPGNDTLAGTCTGVSCGVTVLAGGPGDDVLRGGPASDELSGDGNGAPWPLPGDRPAPDAGRGNDAIDGGGGTDTLTYRERRAGVRVDLARRRADGPGDERDRLAGVEVVEGGDGDDVLLGDGGAQRLWGGPGDDRLEGRGGDDVLHGDRDPASATATGEAEPRPDGADVLRGGDGDDVLDAGSERGDAIYGDAGGDELRSTGDGGALPRPASCGRGSDRVRFDPRGRLLTGCEDVDVSDVVGLVSVRPQRRSSALRFVATCRPGAFGLGCTVKLTVDLRSSRIAGRTVTIPGGARRAVLMRARRPVRAGDVVEVAATMARGTTLAPATRVQARWRARL